MSAPACILTIDNGTSSTKTALWDLSGRMLAEAVFDTPIHHPQPLWAEIDPELWWQAAVETTRAVLARAGADPHSVRAIGVDGISWSLAAVDAALRPLAPAMIWLDRRAAPQAEALQARADAAALVNLCANPLDPAYITPKLLWMQQHQPDVFAAAHCFLTSSGFLTARLTGELTCDYTQAYGYHFFDIRNECWDPAACQALGIPLEKLPRLCACTDIAGGLSHTAAAQLGLPAGVPVIAGCLDAAAGALGAGVTRLGQTNEQGGQAGGMAISTARVVAEPRLIFSHHTLPGQYLLQGGTVGGGSLGWLRGVLAQAGLPLSFEELGALAQSAPPGANNVLFLPYMAGERTPLWSSTARGVFFGLTYNTTAADLARAVLEGCAFSVYHNLQVAAAHGAVAQEFLGSGGATRSPVWRQIKADIYGAPFVTARTVNGDEGGHLLGLFALAAAGAGLVPSAGELVERLLPVRAVVEPVAARHAHYEELFQVYLDLSRGLSAPFERLSAIPFYKED